MSYRKLSEEQIIDYLNKDSCSPEIENLIELSAGRSREAFGSRGYVFAQWGLNCEPCSLDCDFCSLGEKNFSFDSKFSLTVEEAVEGLNRTDISMVSDIFMMCTADYPLDRIYAIGREVRKRIPRETRLVANIGDFDRDQARALKESGYTGFYHIVRLREGQDTKG
ncbi:MAG: radical SAM protein, partial [Spirochaetales bacterium]|nr:radical SAM protein [Spirochaetales bacterium]